MPNDGSRHDVTFGEIKITGKSDLKCFAARRTESIRMRHVWPLHDQTKRERDLGPTMSLLFDCAAQDQRHRTSVVSMCGLPHAMRVFNDPDAEIRRSNTVQILRDSRGTPQLLPPELRWRFQSFIKYSVTQLDRLGGSADTGSR